ncbi:MAG: glutamate racemase [Hyphomicrobiales bacterium]|nr:glutamate racemase [Hyphomicrobiales bacterium]
MPHRRPPHILLFDSGLGGLSVLSALRNAIPEAQITYLADDARFPYGAMQDEELALRLCDVLAAPIAERGVDAILIACNTASTTALPALREAFALPVIGTVPAIKPAAMLSENGLVSVLGTSATVRRDYTHTLIAEYGEGCRYTLVGSSRLAALAEAEMRGERAPDDALRSEIAPCFIESEGKRTDVIVLGCTHYPLLRHRFETIAPWPVTWLDPAPAIARRAANLLAESGFPVGVGNRSEPGEIVFTSGRAISPALAAIFEKYGLVLVKNAQ